MVLHLLEPGSPLHGETPESLVAREAELTLAVSGIDDTSLQPVHARHTWIAPDVVFGARLADVTSDRDDGTFVIDLRQFHELVPAEPVPGFPYPRAVPGPGERTAAAPSPAVRSGGQST
jgi:inward rectifier potassium channel